MPGDEDDERTPLSPSLFEAAFTQATLRNSNDSDASPVTPSTITAPHLAQDRDSLTGRLNTNAEHLDLIKTFTPNNQATTGPFLTAATSGAGTGGGTAVVGSPDIEVALNDEGNITAPASIRWESMFRRFKDRLSKIWEGVNEFMTVSMWAALLSLIVAPVQPFQHALQDHIQPVKEALIAAGKRSIPVTLVVLGVYFYTPPPENSTPEVVATRPPPTTAAARAEEDDGDARRRSGSHWSSSELSTATCRTTAKRSSCGSVDTKKLRSPTTSKRELREPLARKGEGRAVFVAIVSRMLLAPALVLPAVAALAYWDLQRVTDE
ncbi:hypothetical protein FRC01_007686 [Tulasnella sp. 417]|nr:hypothetical protein FRC01_007686 [Tulasnella sp. 417]